MAATKQAKDATRPSTHCLIVQSESSSIVVYVAAVVVVLGVVVVAAGGGQQSLRFAGSFSVQFWGRDLYLYFSATCWLM